MIFGEHQKFSIDIALDSKQIAESNVVLGKIIIWIGEESLGDSGLTVDLQIPADLLLNLVLPVKDREASPLFPMEPKKIFFDLEDILYGGEGDWSSKDEELYSKFNILPGVSEAFDAESLYLLEFKDIEYFVWKKFDSDEVKSMSLPLGTYCEVVSKFSQYIKSL